MSRRRVMSIVAAALLAAPTFARDDFLRATSRDLSQREKQALEERIGELASPAPAARSKAVHLLAVLGRPAAQQLGESLRRGSDPKLLRNACLTLGAMGDVTALAMLEHWLLEENSTEDPTRAALFALGRGKGALSPALADKLRKLMVESPLSTVRESALLCAGARKLAGLPELLDKPLQNEKSARVRGCMLVALAEAGEPAAVPLVARFLDQRKVRDEKLHRAALYAVARLGDKGLLEPLLEFKPDPHEVAAYSVALGAFEDPRAVDALCKLLARDHEKALPAVYALSHVATPAARDCLEKALQGEYSDRVRAAAALAVADLTEQERYLRGLRELSTAAVGVRGKSEALLALARIGDAEAARAIAEALPTWNVRERELLERGLLLCATTLDRPLAQLLPESHRATIAPLCRDVAGVQAQLVHPHVLRERISVALTESCAHWLLQRDRLRSNVIGDLLELDRTVYEPVARTGDGSSQQQSPPPSSGGGDPPPSSPPGGGGDSPPPDGGGGGGSDSKSPPSSGSGGSDASGGFAGLAGKQTHGKQDTARFELDLRQWLIDYSPFEAADPFDVVRPAAR